MPAQLSPLQPPGPTQPWRFPPFILPGSAVSRDPTLLSLHLLKCAFPPEHSPDPSKPPIGSIQKLLKAPQGVPELLGPIAKCRSQAGSQRAPEHRFLRSLCVCLTPFLLNRGDTASWQRDRILLSAVPLTSSPVLGVASGSEPAHPQGCRQLQGKQALWRASQWAHCLRLVDGVRRVSLSTLCCVNPGKSLSLSEF